MTFKEVSNMVGSIGLPFAYYEFPEVNESGDTAVIAPPFVCFYFPEDRDFKADSKNYQKIEHLVIELYSDNKDFTLEASVESVLANNGLVWARSEGKIDSERMYMVTYEMDVVITEEKTNG